MKSMSAEEFTEGLSAAAEGRSEMDQHAPNGESSPMDLHIPSGSSSPGLAQMAEEGVHAGFPSPAANYMTGCIDLNKELVRHPAATFYARVVGDSMIDAGVSEGDILVIDRSLEARDGDMAVCFVDGEFTLKTLSFSDPAGIEKGGSADGKMGESIWLVPANPAYKTIKVTLENDFTVWGVVTYIIKKVQTRSR